MIHKRLLLIQKIFNVIINILEQFDTPKSKDPWLKYEYNSNNYEGTVYWMEFDKNNQNFVSNTGFLQINGRNIVIKKSPDEEENLLSKNILELYQRCVTKELCLMDSYL